MYMEQLLAYFGVTLVQSHVLAWSVDKIKININLSGN